MKRKTIALLVSITVFFAAIYYYVDTVFLPIQLKTFVIAKSEKYLNRPVSIKTLDFSIFKGFIIEGVVVGRKEDPGKPFIEVQKIAFHLLLAPFFRQKTVIIPSVSVEKPFIYLAQDKKNEWNFSDLITLQDESKRRKLPSVLLRKLSIQGGEVYYSNKSKEFSEYITGINLSTTVSLNKGIRFVARAASPKSKAVVRLKGNFNTTDHAVSTQMALENIPIAQYLPLIDSQPTLVELNDGIITKAELGVNIQNNEVQVQGNFLASNTNLNVDGSKNLRGNINASNVFLSWNNNNWNARGFIHIPSAKLTGASGKTLNGDILADLKLFTILDNNITSRGHVTIDNALLELDNNVILKGNVKAQDASLSFLNNAIHIQGNIEVDKTLITVGDQTKLAGSLKTEKTNFIWNARDDTGNRKLTVDSIFKMDSVDFQFGHNRSLSGIIEAQKLNVTFDQNVLHVKTQGQIKNTSIQIEPKQRLEGDPHFNISAKTDFNDGKNSDYKGSLHFIKGRFSQAPYLNDIDHIEGIITVTPDKIQTERLTFNAQATDILLSGELENFDKPKLNVKFFSEKVQIQKLANIVPDLRKHLKADITGLADIKATYKGKLSSPDDADILLSARVSEARIIHDNLDHAIGQLAGNFEYKKDLLQWNNLNAQYNGKTYQLAGKLSDFSRPVIKTEILSDHFRLNTQINILNRAFQFDSLVGTYLNSRFDLKGDVHLFDNADPDVDLRGQFTLDLLDAGELVPRLKHRFDQMNPEGLIAGEGIFKGKFKDWRNWQLTFDATSDYVAVFGYPLTNLAIRYDQRDKNISNCNLTSVIYGGQLGVSSSIDLIDRDAPFSANIKLENLDLKKLQRDKRTKNELLAGLVNFSAKLDGSVFKWRDTVGSGSLSIDEGHIWQWNILDGLSGVLLIPEFKSMAFTKARGDFTIRDQKFHTQNARLVGDAAVLDGVGWIDFDKNLNFNIRPTFSEIAILQSDSRKKKPTSIITQTKDYLNIKLTGTLDKPKYNVEKFPLKILEETIGGTTGTLKEVIGSVVDEIFN